MAPTLERVCFKNFWDKYSARPDNSAMMLNKNADDIEAADRADILGSLPDIKDKDAVDIGAGIGRFTTVLAETARHVLSTDFIDSFVKKNMERNAHLGNIDYAVGDAVNLKLSDNSVDMVFTNWLMMYMSDSEVVEFLTNAIRWLRPNGWMHLRESCSEPSTGRKAPVTMHDAAAANPTSYRFSSLYINIIRSVRLRDAEGRLWRFELHWSCSVPTYIKRMSNWRQVHWLMQKVPADSTETVPTFDELLQNFETTWNEEQKAWDAKLDGESFVWTDSIFDKSLPTGRFDRNSALFVYTPRRLSPFLHINSHRLAEKYGANVWNVELEPYFYRTSLTKANTVKDQRVRFSWHPSLGSSVEYWTQRHAKFDALLATELLSTTESDADLVSAISLLNSGSLLSLLEPIRDIDEAGIIRRLTAAGVSDVVVEEITEEAQREIAHYFKEHNMEPESYSMKWLKISGRV